MTTHSTRQRGGWRRALTGTSIVLLMTAGFTAVTTTSASAADRWVGYKIRTCSYSDCSWMGGRVTANGKKVYRLQPRKNNREGSYYAAKAYTNLNGSNYPSARGTAKTAYILSNYGAYRSATQAAGVDTAVYALVKGGSWRLGYSRSTARTRQTGHGSAVRSYAKSMIANSVKYAGPYKQSMSSTAVAVGSSSKVTYRITSAAGYGMANLPVAITYEGTTVTGYTDSSGYATAYFNVTKAGAIPVSAKTSRVPEWRVFVRKAISTRRSNIAEAGRLATLTASGMIAGTGGQGVAINNGASARMTGAALAGTYTVSGGTGTRTITRSAYGPFSSTAGDCSGTAAYSSSVALDGNGTFALPTYAATRSGYYRWGVQVAANSYTTAASACGAVVKVQKQATVGQYRNGTHVTYGVGKAFRIGARVAGFDRSETHTLTSRLFGPFTYKDNAKCVSDRYLRSVSKSITGNGEFLMPTTAISSSSNAGWYIWQTTLSTGELIRGGTSSCGVLIQVK
ncbi:hypothetical protein GCM10011584_34020 [Nocardioides phosphati]|uniref:Uncharacterized protein n=1 Tax=Nocardioides phosphati TaxID=1867775 RepID=A0ABQ2NF45_9ACTN|nr:hypothetical protein [Nocardioides phosphati]GGO94007.1 hypothetical protein GCM10011584_34020 [Nocardioides phosphati]